MESKRLPRNFYLSPALELAPKLLGKLLRFESPLGTLSGIITEVEAYQGLDDPASHASRGETPRTKVMFGEGGFSYLYFIYGMYWCLNIVTGRKREPSAVLIRAVYPVEGIEQMQVNRQVKDRKNLTNGPGKLCSAFGLNRSHNGLDLTSSKLGLFDVNMTLPYTSTTRVGITKAIEKPWRFLADEACLKVHLPLQLG